MDERKNDLVKEWLLKVMDDFGSAQVLANYSPPYYGTALYHCQQAAEKAFKAFLVFNNISNG